MTSSAVLLLPFPMFARLIARAGPAGSRLAAAGLATGGVAVALSSSASPTQCLFGGAKPDWTKIKKELVDLLDDESAPNPSVDAADGSMGGGGYVAPMMIRLAWHSAGSYGKAHGDGGTQGGTIRM